MAESAADPWLVLRTKSHHENVVESCLKQKRINAFLPRHSMAARRGGSPSVLQVPLFPGYVFVQPRAEQYESMRYVPGSCGLVCAGSKPAAMPERELEAVRIFVTSGIALGVNRKLIPGRRVRIVAGPFGGIEGELVRVKNRQRLVINACLLSSSVSVEIDEDKICLL